MIALVLLVGTTLAAVVLARRYHLGDGAVLIPVLGSLPTLYLTYVMYRDSQEDADLTLSQLADQLAGSVRRQWTTEAQARRLYDPYPLPVSWRAADSSLVDDWATVEALAASGAGWPVHSETRAAGTAELAGAGADLAVVLERIPTGRLVVLGEPGSGKTMLLVRLVLDLLNRREDGGPVPVLVSVASWDPVAQDLHSWLAAQLGIGYPGLAAAGPAGERLASRASALIDAGLVLPVLDGLDEIPAAVRGPTITRINDALRPGERLVVACRTDQFREAIRPHGGAEVTLRGAAGVELRPLSVTDVAKYLRVDAGGPAGAARWDPVLAAFTVHPAPPAAAVLTSPLMVTLARTIYNKRPGEPHDSSQTVPDPAELCALASRMAVERHLLDAFVPAAFRAAEPGRPHLRSWSAAQAEDWLAFLARSLDREHTSELAWWHLAKTLSGKDRGAVFAVGYATLTWLGVWAGFGLWSAGRIGALPALLAGLGIATIMAVGGFLFGQFAAVLVLADDVQPVRGIRLQWSSAAAWGLVAGLICGFIALLAVWVKGGSVTAAVFTMLAIVVAFTMLFALSGSLGAAPTKLGTAATPQSVLSRDRSSSISLMVMFAAGVGIPVGLVAGSREGRVGGSVLALVIGLIVGPLASSAKTAWPRWLAGRIFFSLQHQIPWRYMKFLEDARERGILRQVGPVHQFRHIELQHRLAQHPQRRAARRVH